MSTTDKTADQLIQSIRKTKSATPAANKAPAVSAVAATPPKSAVKKTASAPSKAAETPAAQPQEEAPRSFQRSPRVWPD